MAKKRPSLRGRGKEMFTPGPPPPVPSDQQAGVPAHQPPPKYPKATFYLPASTLAKLERVWLANRARKPKLKKSDLVRNALEAFLTQEEKNLAKISPRHASE